MPSWKIHSKWGTKLLGFSEREIDYLIDSTHVENHDAGCWDEKVLERQLSMLHKNMVKKGNPTTYYTAYWIEPNKGC
ncbi:MAG: hypothetical protein DRO98_07180 [Archaeoglobales archaeon]|nr:MAG: hypothetical protein DRO98_07180 [Archaeoglobales archaeon]